MTPAHGGTHNETDERHVMRLANEPENIFFNFAEMETMRSFTRNFR
ncbi:MAG: hypothetical protein HY719_13335 [Planctomycetes bacterium]|nr:hypothetical protein [Planctomycetota bacterium]